MSMSSEVMKWYLHLPSTYDNWKVLSKIFYGTTYELQVFALNKAFSTKQRCKTLSVYYGELIKNFSELDHHDKVIMESDKEMLKLIEN